MILKISTAVFGILLLISPARVGADSYPGDAVEIPGGEFTMGDSYCAQLRGNDDWCRDEIPHQVRVDAFAIDKFEVTNSKYQKCFAAGVCDPAERHENRPGEFDGLQQPVVFVTWKDAVTYCRWQEGRLPTEAEWERAAQGERLGGAQYGMEYDRGSPKPVGQLNPNSHGLYDMLGNVYEWTRDWYGAYETEGMQVNPRGPETGTKKVVRGGSWNSPPHYLRPADRVSRDPELRYSDVGFRCVYPVE